MNILSNIFLSIFMFLGIITLLFLMYLIYQMIETFDSVIEDWINLISFMSRKHK